jgi:hypothetical protein
VAVVTPSAKIIAGAEVLMRILEDGPGPKTGLSGEITLALDKGVSPREFADMVQYCRRVLGPQAGKAVVWSTSTRQYGFAEDLKQVETYIYAFNTKYMATRAETMAATCGAGLAQHGHSFELVVAKDLHESYAKSCRTMADAYMAGVKVHRAALRTGLDAPTQLEERVS